MENSTVIDVRQAVEKAMEYLRMLYAGEGIGNVLLEEVELSDDEQEWLVTLGFDRLVRDSFNPLDQMANPLGNILRPKTTREYKVFHVGADDGRVISMKLRPL